MGLVLRNSMLCLLRLLNLASGDIKVQYNINLRLQANYGAREVKFVCDMMRTDSV